LEQRDYDFKADIFSLGLVMVGIFVEFENEKEHRSVLIGSKRDRELPEDYIFKYKLEGNLIKSMTESDPQNRPNIEQVIREFEILYKKSPSRVFGKKNEERMKRIEILIDGEYSYLKPIKMSINVDSWLTDLTNYKIVECWKTHTKGENLC